MRLATTCGSSTPGVSDGKPAAPRGELPGARHSGCPRLVERREEMRKEGELTDGPNLQRQMSHFMCCGVLETKIQNQCSHTKSKYRVCCAQNHQLRMCYRQKSLEKEGKPKIMDVVLWGSFLGGGRLN